MSPYVTSSDKVVISIGKETSDSSEPSLTSFWKTFSHELLQADDSTQLPDVDLTEK